MTPTITERVTGEADLIKKQLRQPGMYPTPKTPLPPTLCFVPRPTPTFQPIAPDASPEPVNTHHTNKQQDAETSSDSSLPCGQWTPIDLTSINSTPPQHTPPQSVVPPQPATPQSHNSDHPVTFVSGLFRGSQLNWAALMKEAFAIYMSVKKLSFYMTYAQILQKNTLNSKVNNWAMELEAFNIQFDYIKGFSNVLADTLSHLIVIDNDTLLNFELI